MRLPIAMLLLPLLLVAFDSQLKAAEPNSITGRVYCDTNQNSTCDCEEVGLADIEVQIFIDHCSGTAVQTISTDEEGNFTFRNFDPATYFVRVSLDYVCGGRLPTNSSCQEVELQAGEAVSLAPFGLSDYGQ
jgi:hypothetical protein